MERCNHEGRGEVHIQITDCKQVHAHTMSGISEAKAAAAGYYSVINLGNPTSNVAASPRSALLLRENTDAEFSSIEGLYVTAVISNETVIVPQKCGAAIETIAKIGDHC